MSAYGTCKFNNIVFVNLHEQLLTYLHLVALYSVVLILVFDLHHFECWHSNLNSNVQISMSAFELECNQRFYVFLFQTMDEETASGLMSH